MYWYVQQVELRLRLMMGPNYVKFVKGVVDVLKKDRQDG